MKTMDCTEARTLMVDARRGRLAGERQVDDAFRAHLGTCEACTAADRADEALSEALSRLPKRRAPTALRAALEARFAGEEREEREERRGPRFQRWRRPLAAAGAAAALALGVAAGTAFVVRSHDASDAMVAEAVNDHLRVLYSEHPVEIESGGIHQVKPWFAGRVDFAPVVPFAGDAEFPLKGGAVAWFLDRKAAAFVFTRRLHTITLFVFRSDGLAWPVRGSERIGSRDVFARASRGFHVLLWRNGDLGYALASDVAEDDLRELAQRLETK